MSNQSPFTRRNFLRTAGTVATGLMVVPRHVVAASGETPPSEKLNIAAIGATIIAKSPRFRKIRDRLYDKYPQYPDMSAIGERDSVIVEVTPRHAFSWGMDE